MTDMKKLNELKISIRKLGPKSTETDFRAAFGKLRAAFPAKGQFAERRSYGKAIYDIRERGFHPDAALVNQGHLEIKEASSAGLRSLREKLKDENHRFDPTGMQALADEFNANPAISGVLKKTGEDILESVEESKSKLKFGRVAAKVGKAVLKSADLVENTLGAGKVARNTYLVAQAIDELNRRSPKNPKPSTSPEKVSTGLSSHRSTSREDAEQAEERKPEPSELNETQKFVIEDGAGRDVFFEDATQDARRGTKQENSLSSVNETLIDELTKLDDPLEEILDKNPAELTEGEVRAVMLARKAAGTATERDRLFDIEKAFFEDKYGTRPARHDATGRMIPPEAIRPINETPVPARGADGRPRAESLATLARAVAAPDVIGAFVGGHRAAYR